MNTQKISQYFFIIAAVISILDGAFALDETMTSIKLMFLLIAGIVVGILRHDKTEKEFILAGVAVIFTGLIFTQLMGTYTVLKNFTLMIGNFIIFLATAVIVVGIEIISEIVTTPPDGKKKKIVHKKLSNLSEEELKKITFQKIWGTVILVAVALTFIILLAESFFDVSQIQEMLMVIEGAITVLFLVDLIILYNDSKNFNSFLKNNIFDIIASIPTVGILRGLKIIRAIKILKVMKLAKSEKLTKLYKTSKFFSEESDFNKVNDGSLNVTGKPKKNKTTKSKAKKTKPKVTRAKNKIVKPKAKKKAVKRTKSKIVRAKKETSKKKR